MSLQDRKTQRTYTEIPAHLGEKREYKVPVLFEVGAVADLTSGAPAGAPEGMDIKNKNKTRP